MKVIFILIQKVKELMSVCYLNTLLIYTCVYVCAFVCAYFYLFDRFGLFWSTGNTIYDIWHAGNYSTTELSAQILLVYIFNVFSFIFQPYTEIFLLAIKI